MRRTSPPFALLALVPLCSFGSQSPEEPRKPSTAGEQGLEAIVVGLPDPSVARGLLTWGPNGEFDGFGRRLVELAARNAGLEVEFRQILAGTGERELLDGEVDVLCPLSVSTARIESFDFTTPILIVGGAVFTRSGERPPTNVEELVGKRIVVALSGIAHQFCVEEGLPCETKTSLHDALQSLSDGQADCLISTRVAGRFDIEHYGFRGLVDAPLNEEKLSKAFALAMRKGDARLQARLNFGLALARDSGAWDVLYDQWVAHLQPLPRAPSFLPFVVGALVLLVCMGLVVLLGLRARLASSARALDESEGFYRLVAESLPALVYSRWEGHDGRCELRFATSNMEDWRARFPGLSPGEDLRSLLFDVHPDDRARYEGLALRAREGGTRFEAEFRLRAKDGNYCWLHSTATPLRGADGTLWQSLLLDTTPLRESQDEGHRQELQLSQTRQLEGLGLLVGGIAHDFNNLLLDVQGNVELARDETDPSERNARLMAAMEATRRAGERTQQLLASAGEAWLNEELTDLAPMTRKAVQIERNRPNLQVDLDLAQSVVEVRGDPTLLDQVIGQLIENAVDAVPRVRGGRVLVRLGARHCTAEELGAYQPTRAPGAYAELVVKDDGVGMDADKIRRIFDPFFSTKFVGRGLGLALVKRAVERHGGALRVSSALGEGTTFSVFLPLAEQRAPMAAAKSEPFRGQSNRVLVVDDDERVLSVACALLQKRGWGVARALDAERALDAVREAPPGVVLLDLSMPGTGGIELLRRLRTLFPTLPVVLMSGYSEEEVAGENLAADGFVSKPFTGARLDAALRKAAVVIERSPLLAGGKRTPEKAAE